MQRDIMDKFTSHLNSMKSDTCGYKEGLCSACAFRFNCEDYIIKTEVKK